MLTCNCLDCYVGLRVKDELIACKLSMGQATKMKTKKINTIQNFQNKSFIINQYFSILESALSLARLTTLI